MAKHILFVEDDSLLRDILENFLKKSGFEVTVAHDGAEALQLAKQVQPDLILLDILLPKKNGFDVLAQIRQDQNITNTPVIILSNFNDPADIKRGQELRVVEYMVKATTIPEEIVTKIKAILG